MKTYAVSCLLGGKSFEAVIRANSASDAMAIVRQQYGSGVAIFGARQIG